MTIKVTNLSISRSKRPGVRGRRLANLDLPKHFGTRNPLTFMDLQDVQELSNFFERRVAAYQVGGGGSVGFDESF